MAALWQRLPIIVRAVLAGALAATAGTVPWAVLVSQNMKHASAVPWAVLPAAIYLGFFWQYAGGAGWPKATSEARRASRRANRLSDDAWGMALVAGGLGLVAVVLLQVVMNRLVRLPAEQKPDISHIPLVTVLLLVIMSAIVAGVAEETSFRGYMQGPIEQRHGPVVAILVTGSLFGFAHFTHPEVGLILLPYYIAVAAVYGMLAYLTNSILPSLVLHAGGNMLGAFDLFTRGHSEWQASPTPKPLVWETGADASFWMSVVGAVVASAVAVWAYKALASAVRRSPQ